MSFRKHLPLIVGALVLLFGLVVGCGDNKTTPPPDKGRPDVTVDAPAQQPDLFPQWDKPKWPDKGTPDTKRPFDVYASGQPFGCQTDSDCFGQKCCPTPWGVKLCAPTCDLK